MDLPIYLSFATCLLFLIPHDVRAGYSIGVGIADVTGPSAEVGFMGYADASQKGKGIHLRQFSRAFIIDDGRNRLAFVVVDCGMMATGLRKVVIAELQKIYGSIYTEQNVMLSGTHTHSGPGGFNQNLLFDLSILGFVRQTFVALMSGIVISIRRAHESMRRGRIYVSEGELHDANINRSPTAYLANHPDERAKYQYDVDKIMLQLKLVTENDKPIGVINWFAVHPTSMNNTNKLVSSDNVGYASVLFEKRMNPGALIGKGPFVAAFASTNLGDVSPNIAGPRCEFSGRICDVETSTCSSPNERCFASGPGKDMFDSTRIIAERMFNKAWSLWSSKDGEEIKGSLRVVHQFVDMPSQKAEYFDPFTRKLSTVRGCLPAMGYSFAAGTTDGPGATLFHQGTKTTNPLWNMLRNFLAKPTAYDIECHNPKPILLATGEMDFPFEWQPRIVSTQLALVGDIALACVPGEFTTMAGRRLRDAINGSIIAQGGSRNTRVVVVGLCNTYSDYITTPEEYKVQRYEGASTIFGPHTLTLYLSQYRRLAAALLQNSKLDSGPEPPDLSDDLISLVSPVIMDTPKWNHKFGDCLVQPEETVGPGDLVSVKFVSAHPRNNLTLGASYLTVERLEEDINRWTIVATDANFETRFHWIRVSPVLGTSEALITWNVGPDVLPGTYRIQHFGSYKYIFGGIYPFVGTSRTFKVVNKNEKYRRGRSRE